MYLNDKAVEVRLRCNNCRSDNFDTRSYGEGHLGTDYHTAATV